MKSALLGLIAFPLVAIAPSCAEPVTEQMPEDLGHGVGGGAGTSGGAAGQAGSAMSQAGSATGNTGGSSSGAGGAGGSATGGASGTGGAGGTGGTGGSSGGSAGSATNGGAGAGGSSGGAAPGGRGGGGTPSGGRSAAGAAGSGGGLGGSGGGGVGTAAMPSPGCTKGTARPANGLVTVSGNHTYWFPTTYNGTTPFPLTFGLHGAGNSDTSFRSTDAKTQSVGDFEKDYVMAYLKSSGNDWTGQLQTNYTRFDMAFDELTNNYCIDMNRVFAIGHSSGAQFISNLICRPENRLKAVGPVASSNYTGANCRKIPVMAIQGSADSVRMSDGADWINAIATRNGCTMTKMPFEEATCSSYSGGTMVQPGCNEFQGCMAPNRVVWCSHNDPNYNGGKNHGWPCFANDALHKFFASIP